MPFIRRSSSVTEKGIYYINTSEIPGELSRENMMPSHVTKTPLLYGYVINCAFRSENEKVWISLVFKIINRILCGRLEI